MDDILVLKLDLQGRETWRYTGRVLERASGSITIEARFNRPDMLFHGILFGQNDRFVETYYADRRYNIFEIHSRDDDTLRGWYCNVTRMPVINLDTISYVDLALDLLVYPDGRQLVLDEDEFDRLPITPEERAQAVSALQDLQKRFAEQMEL